MILPLHVFIALLSIVMSGLTFARPSNKHFRSSYILVAGTLVTGTLLVLQSPTHLGTACMSGLTYLAFVSAMLAAAHRKVADKA